MVRDIGGFSRPRYADIANVAGPHRAEPLAWLPMPVFCSPMTTGRLTTHVLDTASGRPACGIPVRLILLDPSARLLTTAVTNADGRCDAPLLEGPAFCPGRYELTFSVGAYFRQHHPELPEPAFLDEIVLRFGIHAADQHYHVPLLVSPFSYSTYRGS